MVKSFDSFMLHFVLDQTRQLFLRLIIQFSEFTTSHDHLICSRVWFKTVVVLTAVYSICYINFFLTFSPQFYLTDLVHLQSVIAQVSSWMYANLPKQNLCKW